MNKSDVNQTGTTASKQLNSHDEAIEAVRELLPSIAARAAATNNNRKVSSETIKELEQSGLFGILTPRGYGGSALGWKTFASVVMALGSACGSSAWTYGVLTGHNHMLTRFPESVQKPLLSDPSQHVSVVFRITDPFVAIPAEGGGYKLSGGQGRFCSGIDHAKWVGVTSVIKGGENDGQLAFCLLEQKNVKQLDDWHTVGMRGTGSRSIIIDDVFVSDDMTILGVDLMGPPVGPAADEGTFYSWPYLALAPFAIVGAPVGVARGMLNAATASLKNRVTKFEADQEMISNMSTSFSRLSHAAEDIDIAEMLITKDLDLIDNQEFGSVDPLEMIRFRRNWAAAPKRARYATTSLFEGIGGSGLYEQAGFERMLRDVNAGSAHFAFTDDTASTNYGRALLGLPPARTDAFV